MKKEIVFLTLVGLFFLSSIPVSTAQADAGGTCTTAEATVEIKAVPSVAYDVDKLVLPKDTCVEIKFTNTDSVYHDFVVDAFDVIQKIDIDGDVGATNSYLIQTPNKDLQSKYYCSVGGHRAAGMEGDFIIGNGAATKDDTPGFGLFLGFLSVVISAAALNTIRRK